MSEDPRGGYRRPRHPAAASGPGALSQRTDGGAPDAPPAPNPAPPQQPPPAAVLAPHLAQETAPQLDPVVASATPLEVLEAVYEAWPTRRMRSIVERAVYYKAVE